MVLILRFSKSDRIFFFWAKVSVSIALFVSYKSSKICRDRPDANWILFRCLTYNSHVRQSSVSRRLSLSQYEDLLFEAKLKNLQKTTLFSSPSHSRSKNEQHADGLCKLWWMFVVASISRLNWFHHLFEMGCVCLKYSMRRSTECRVNRRRFNRYTLTPLSYSQLRQQRTSLGKYRRNNSFRGRNFSNRKRLAYDERVCDIGNSVGHLSKLFQHSVPIQI